jgi:hypothetical protein
LLKAEAFSRIQQKTFKNSPTAAQQLTAGKFIRWRTARGKMLKTQCQNYAHLSIKPKPANYRGMVCSFITSAEYQLGFGNLVTRSNAECQ